MNYYDVVILAVEGLVEFEDRFPESSLEFVSLGSGSNLFGNRNPNKARSWQRYDSSNIAFHSLSESENRFKPLFSGTLDANLKRKSWRVLDFVVA